MKALAVLVALGLVACSGASAPEIPAASKGQSQTSSETSKTEPPPASSSQLPDKAAPNEPGAPPPDQPPAPTPTGNGCVAEVEGNNMATQATPFTSCVTGTVERGDVDYLRITAPQGTDEREIETMVIEHKEQGRLTYRVTSEGDLPLLGENETFTDGTQEIEVKAGGTYLIRVSRGMGGPGGDTGRAYEISVSFK